MHAQIDALAFTWACECFSDYLVGPAELLITSELPELPFQKVGTDLFEWEKRIHLLLFDCC